MAAGQLPHPLVAPWVVAAGQLPHHLVTLSWVEAAGQLSHPIALWVAAAGQLPIPLLRYPGLRPLANYLLATVPFVATVRPFALW